MTSLFGTCSLVPTHIILWKSLRPVSIHIPDRNRVGLFVMIRSISVGCHLKHVDALIIFLRPFTSKQSTKGLYFSILILVSPNITGVYVSNPHSCIMPSMQLESNDT